MDLGNFCSNLVNRDLGRMVCMMMAVVGTMGMCMFLLVDPKDWFLNHVPGKTVQPHD